MSTRSWTPLYSALCSSSRDAELPDDTCRAFYPRLLTVLDSYGCASLKPNVIHAKVWPLLGKPVSETIRCLEACERVGLLEFHGIDGREWVLAPDWEEKAGKHLASSKRRGAREYPEATPATRISGGIRRHPAEPGGSAQTERQTELRESLEREEKGATPRPRKARLPLAQSDVAGTCLDSPRFFEAWGRWEEAHGRYLPVGLKGQITRLSKWGLDRAVAAIRYSTAQGFTGVYEDRSNGVHQSTATFEPPAHSAIRKILEQRHATA